MRDTNEGMVELLGATKIDSAFGCEAVIQLNGEDLRLRFNVSERGYMLLKKLISFQPFESVTAGKYRYYSTGSYRRKDEVNALAGIRVEQGTRHKQFELELPLLLVVNLRWLQQVTERQQVEHLLQ
jgi:hypothetical protein